MNKRQEKISELEEAADRIKTVVYYGADDDMKNVKDRIEELEYVSDRITLAQIANDFELASQLIDSFITDEQEKELYMQLRETNVDIDETLNIELLSAKYSFFGGLLGSIVTDIEVQQRIISLSDGRLELFKQLFDKIKDEVSNPIPIITSVLKDLGTSPHICRYNDCNRYQSLNSLIEEHLKHGGSLSESDKEKLLFLYTSNNTNFIVETLDDLTSFGEKSSKSIIKIDEMVDKERKASLKNIANIKNALLWKSYGIGLRDAETIIKRYKAKGVEVTDENRETMQLYLCLCEIVSENDAEKLIKIFDEFSEQKETSFNYMSPLVIEDELKNMFLQEFNKVTYKTDNQLPTNIDGIQVYNAGTDFKMIMTSVGAYQGKMTVNNYYEYWNSPHIRSHGNCCSLIANNNLSTAEIKNICLGFSNFNSGTLLRAANYDLNSTKHSRELDFLRVRETFMLPNDLINSTRSTYNELVYERRELSDGSANNKKNPDYIVFFEEFDGENIENLTDEDIQKETDEEKRKLLQMQKRLWKETKKAAIDFSRTDENGKVSPLPIVKINREECAKSEMKKIQESFSNYLETSNPSLLSDIIVQFENNRIGNRFPHDHIRETYFPRGSIEKMLNQIIDHMKGIEDKSLRCDNINTMEKLISTESKNWKEGSQTFKQLEGFNHSQYLQELKEIRQVEMQNYNR